ncbi:MAG TPA: metal ABC transporter substrate-binding protein [Xanthobacteraceae bacterium]|nr:metal ABC transporter substrate-binding protein [Xanthobacteraceae bacterium]
MFRRSLAVALFVVAFAAPAFAQDKLPVVASFSILGDFVKNVGGERVALTTLVGPDGDAHVYSATPADAKNLAAAKVVFVNGLGFEGWMDRLVKASGTKAPLVTVTRGIKTRRLEGGHGHDHGHSHAETDPHAWQSVANAKIYVANIRDALAKADPAGKADYEANAKAYLETLDALEKDIRSAVGGIAEARRRVITSHEAFAYFEAAYGIDFVAPQGVSTESEASAQDVAKIIRQIRAQKIPAVFLENVSDARLVKRIADETGARIGGTLYSDALSGAEGPAPTYIDMMRHNLRQLAEALGS